jgi:hypothetical protein
MKKSLLKIGIVTIALIFAFTGASWADGRKNGKNHQGAGKYYQNKHYSAAGHHPPAYYNKGWNKGHYSAVARHHYRPKVVHQHYYYPEPVYVQPYYPPAYAPGYYAYAPAYNEFSVSALIVQPGFAFSIATGSQW